MKLLIGAGVLIVSGLLAGACSFKAIDSGNIGVVKHFGAVQMEVLNEGAHLVRPFPFASVSEVPITIQKTEQEADAASKDLQAVHTKIAIQWSVSPALAPKLVQGFGQDWNAWSESVMAPGIQEVVKAVCSRYTAEELITKRTEVHHAVEVDLNVFIQKTLLQKDAKDALKIANLAMTNFAFSQEFNNAIEAKVKAEQDALKAVNEKTKRITNAEADAAEKRLAADAYAYEVETKSKASADAIKREANALSENKNLLDLRAIERWDGKLPQYSGGAVPFINVK